MGNALSGGIRVGLVRTMSSHQPQRNIDYTEGGVGEGGLGSEGVVDGCVGSSVPSDALRNSRTPLPTAPNNSGIFPTPKSMTTITKIKINSTGPSRNI